jgi:hypothetical protein
LVEPGDSALDDPAAGQDDETVGVGTLDYLAATPNRRAAARQLTPLSTAASARDQRSIDDGLPIHAGLYPASTVNQISASV